MRNARKKGFFVIVAEYLPGGNENFVVQKYCLSICTRSDIKRRRKGNHKRSIVLTSQVTGQGRRSVFLSGGAENERRRREFVGGSGGIPPRKF